SLDPRGAWMSDAAPVQPDEIAFMFPGQGSQYTGMLGEIAMAFPEARAAIERASAQLGGVTPAPLDCLIFPAPAFDDSTRAAQEMALKQTDVAQPAIAAASLAMLKVLAGFGLAPAMCAGHSFGEYTAL